MIIATTWANAGYAGFAIDVTRGRLSARRGDA